MAHGRYHSLLRTSAVVVAMVLMFDGGFINPFSKQLSDNTIEYLASSAVGVFANIEPNGINEFTAELTKKQQELDAREAALSEREIQARDFGSRSENDYSTYILSAILFLLTVLIMLNYTLDWMRVRKLYVEGNPS